MVNVSCGFNSYYFNVNYGLLLDTGVLIGENGGDDNEEKEKKLYISFYFYYINVIFRLAFNPASICFILLIINLLTLLLIELKL